MEPPPLSAPPIATVAPPLPSSAPHINYPDSVDSSPRSRNTDSWDDPPPYGPASAAAAATVISNSTTAPTTKLRLMCSFGGHIVPRPHDKSLCYVGGDTRIIVVDRQTSLSDLHHRLSKTLLNGKSFSLKYQLPSEDLDSLISVTTDEDLENMIDEYDRLLYSSTGSNSSAKTSRIRLFLFPSNLDSDSSSSIESLIENSSKSQQWFFNALNWTAPEYKVRTFSETSSVNYLLGLDDAVNNPAGKAGEAQLEASLSMKSAGGDSAKQIDNINNISNHDNSNNGAQDVQSVPDSPMLETTSSFGSTSSSPSIVLPRIRVHVEEGNNQKGVTGLGIEEQLQQMNVVGVGVAVGANGVQKPEHGGLAVVAPGVVGTGTVVTGLPVAVGGEYQNRVYSDDERSEQGIPVGYRKPPQAQPQQQQLPQLQQQQQQQQASQLQPSKMTGGFDVHTPDSVSSDGSVTNPLSRHKPMMYQEPIVQLHSGNGRNLPNQLDSKAGDSNSRVQLQQQGQESGYVLPSQFDQYQQLHQPQQFLPAGTQYIHHHAPGAVPYYYPIYPPQQLSHPHTIEHQYPVYFVPARQTQAYNASVQQTSFTESTPVAPSSRPQTPASSMVPPTAVYGPASSAPAAKADLTAGVYQTSAAAGPHLMQIPSSQSSPQYSGFTQNHHPSQSTVPSSVATSNYAYEFTDPAHAQIYYTQHLASQLAAQYQTMNSAPQMMLSESSAQLPTENLKQHIRTPQQ